MQASLTYGMKVMHPREIHSRPIQVNALEKNPTIPICNAYVDYNARVGNVYTCTCLKALYVFIVVVTLVFVGNVPEAKWDTIRIYA